MSTSSPTPTKGLTAMFATLAASIPNPATDAYFDVRAAYKAGIVDEATWASYVRAAVIPNGPKFVEPLVTFSFDLGLDGCRCGGIGRSGAHRVGCPWAVR